MMYEMLNNSCGASYAEWLPTAVNGYEVSSEGRVRSIERIITTSTGVQRHVKGRILKQASLKSGYRTVSLGNAYPDRYVHRLVLEAFIGQCPSGMEACHNDGNRGNNALSNLRWDTRSSNGHDAVGHGTHWQTRKTTCPRGHPYDLIGNNGKGPARRCRRCDNENRRNARRLRQLAGGH